MMFALVKYNIQRVGLLLIVGLLFGLLPNNVLMAISPQHSIGFGEAEFSTFYGGSSVECSFERCAIAVDPQGYIYIAAVTGSDDFPLVNEFSGNLSQGGSDVILLKLAPNGTSVIYSTYLGGGNPSSVVADSFGNVYVTGYTSDVNFPTTANALQACGNSSIFVTKLNATGDELLYGTCLGGNNNDRGIAIDIDSDQNMYVVGYTQSDDFPTVNAVQATFGGDHDAFAFKISADGNDLLYSTYLGGADNDRAFDIELDGFGNAHITGVTESIDFPVTPGPFQSNLFGSTWSDGFVTKLNPDGSLSYSTYLGVDDGPEHFIAIAVDYLGNAYMTGPNDFKGVTKLNPAGNALVYQTEVDITIGVEAYDGDLVVDSNGNIVLVGHAGGGGNRNIAVAALNQDGRIVYQTEIGGSDNDNGTGVALYEDGTGNVDAFIVGYTESSDFPTLNPIQPTLNGDSDLVIFNKLDLQTVFNRQFVFLPMVRR